MGGTLRTVRTVADEKPRERTSRRSADRLHGLAKVRVASSNLVIRSKTTPGQRPFSGPLISFSGGGINLKITRRAFGVVEIGRCWTGYSLIIRTSVTSHSQDQVPECRRWGTACAAVWMVNECRSLVATGYVDELSNDYRVIAIDRLGHGESDKPHDSSLYRERLIVDDLVAVLDAEDIDRAIVWGYSLGAKNAASFAVRFPAHVARSDTSPLASL